MTRRIACPAASSSRSGSRGAPWPGSSSSAIGERTAGVIHLVSPVHEPARRPRRSTRSCGSRTRAACRCIVDAASMIPPRDEPLPLPPRGRRSRDLQRRQGHPRAPEHRHPRRPARPRSARPRSTRARTRRIGRAAKTSKEEIVGLVTALELFLAEDEKAEMERYRDGVRRRIVDGLARHPGPPRGGRAGSGQPRPAARGHLLRARRGRARPAARCSSPSPQGEPHIYVQQGAASGRLRRRDRRSTPSTCNPGTTPSSSRGCARSSAGVDGAAIPRPRDQGRLR